MKSTLRAAGGQPGHAGDRRGDPAFYSPNFAEFSPNVSLGRKIIDENAGGESSEEEEDGHNKAQSPNSSSTPVPASHAAIAAACRAGEEADRRRMTSPPASLTTTVGELTPALQLSPRRRQSDDHFVVEQTDEEEEDAIVQQPESQQEESGVDIVASATTATSPLQTENTTQEHPDNNNASDKTKRTRMGLKQFSIIKSPHNQQPDTNPNNSDLHPTFHFHGPRSVRHWINKRRHHELSSDNIRSYVKGKVIDRQHELFIMSIAIMLGMRTSIGRTNMQMAETSHDERRWLDNDDLMAVEKYVFPPRVSYFWYHSLQFALH